MDAIVKRPTLHLRFSTDTGTRRSPIKSFADLKPPAAKPEPTSKNQDLLVAYDLLSAVRDVPHLPKHTRKLRLTIAAIDAMPTMTPNYLTFALKQVKGADAMNAEELRKAIYESVNNAQMQRHKALIASTLAYVEEEARPTERREFAEDCTRKLLQALSFWLAYLLRGRLLALEPESRVYCKVNAARCNLNICFRHTYPHNG